MNYNLNTINSLKLYLQRRLKSLYPANEINSIADNIIRTLFNLDRLHQLQNSDYEIPSSKEAELKEICDRLAEGMPVQYVLGETIFYDCRLKINNKTLIPRQETEELVDLIIKENPDFSGKLLDIGTGPGTIAIALASKMPGAKITAVDFSEEALETAKQNAVLNNVKITFQLANILDPDFNVFQGMFDIIVSNPPYVPESEKKEMHINVTGYEPETALFVPDSDPLVFYRAILRKKDSLLVPGGRFYFEMHEKMGKTLKKLMSVNGITAIRIISDINGKERFITGLLNG
ncbi:MAG: peptide chain release factor N(5)-glutamine methyltransferase [Bacteroidales bacterium]